MFIGYSFVCQLQAEVDTEVSSQRGDSVITVAHKDRCLGAYMSYIIWHVPSEFYLYCSREQAIIYERILSTQASANVAMCCTMQSHSEVLLYTNLSSENKVYRHFN